MKKLAEKSKQLKIPICLVAIIHAWCLYLFKDTKHGYFMDL